MGFELLVILLLVLVNGLFAGAEIACVTLRSTRIEQLVAEGRRGAHAVALLRANPERFLATVQVGITVVSAGAAAYGGDTIVGPLTALLSRAPTLAPYAHEVSFVIVVGSISYLSIVLGELVPKSLALRAPERYALIIARPFIAIAQAARPVVWLLTASSNVVLRVFGDSTSFTEGRLSSEELKALLEDASEQGAVHPAVGEMATRALELSELSAEDVMVPRRRIAALEKGSTITAMQELVAETGHSRLPVYDGTVDNVIGYVSTRDVFRSGAARDALVDAFIRPVFIVPETMPAVSLLDELQRRAARLAIVVDEHGGTAGLLTREDLVEEIVGEMLGADRGAPEKLGIVREPEGGAVVPGAALVRDVNRELELKLPEEGDWTTISGMCVGLLGHMPKKGDVIDVVPGHRVEVLDASPRRVRAVRVSTVAPPSTPEA